MTTTRMVGQQRSVVAVRRDGVIDADEADRGALVCPDQVRAQRRRHTELNAESRRSERPRQMVGRCVLLVPRFGVGVQKLRGFPDHPARGADGGVDPLVCWACRCVGQNVGCRLSTANRRATISTRESRYKLELRRDMA